MESIKIRYKGLKPLERVSSLIWYYTRGDNFSLYLLLDLVLYDTTL